MAFLDDLAANVLHHPSAWRLASTGSVSGSVGLSKVLYVAGTGGTFHMAMGDGKHTIPFNYGGAGGGGGVALSVLGPVAGSFSSSQFPSTGGEWGRLYLAPSIWACSELDADSINGPAALINFSADLIAGGSISLVFFGAVNLADALSPVSVLGRAKAVAFQAGLEVTTTYGVGVTGYQLWITGHGKME